MLTVLLRYINFVTVFFSCGNNGGLVMCNEYVF